MRKSVSLQTQPIEIQEDPFLKALHAYLDQMFYRATVQGETQLLHRIFSV